MVADREWVLGARHPDTLAARSDLAAAYLAAGRQDQALPLYEQTLADLERGLGPAHPDTLAARAGLAQAYHAAGQLKQAVPLYERTLADRERAQGPDHPDTISARADLAYAYRTAGRMKQALPQYERVARRPGTGAGQLPPGHADRPRATWPTPTSPPGGSRTRSRSTSGP